MNRPACPYAIIHVLQYAGTGEFANVGSSNSHPTLAIKPLDLAKDEANLVYDHGGHWVERIRRLKKHALLPDEVLFAVQKPRVDDRTIRAAADEIVADLREQGVEVAAATDVKAIAEFAGAARVH
jgi:hypothetical protein